MLEAKQVLQRLRGREDVSGSRIILSLLFFFSFFFLLKEGIEI
jgi:hypothetical protein